MKLSKKDAARRAADILISRLRRGAPIDHRYVADRGVKALLKRLWGWLMPSPTGSLADRAACRQALMRVLNAAR